MTNEDDKEYNLEEFEDRIVLQLAKKLSAEDVDLLREDLLTKMSGEDKPKVMLIGVASFGNIPAVAMLEAQKSGMSTMIVCHPEAVKGDLSQLPLMDRQQLLVPLFEIEKLTLAKEDINFDYVVKENKKTKPYVPKKIGVVNSRLKGRNGTGRR